MHPNQLKSDVAQSLYVAIEAGKQLAGVTIDALRTNIQDRRTISQLDEERAAYQIDELTGTLLRRAYIEKSDALRGSVHRGDEEHGFDTVLVALTDLKKMHTINNRMGGQQAGDEVLRVYGHRLCELLADYDVTSVPARLGGDEFGITVAFDSSRYPVSHMKEVLHEGTVVWADTETPFGVNFGDIVESSLEKSMVELFSEADPKRPKTWLQRFSKYIADARYSRQRG